MPLDKNKKIVFIHIPKNAGTAIEKSYNMSYSGHHDWKYYQNILKDDWDSYKKVCVFRDPLERFISCYNYAKMENSYWHSIYGNSRDGKHPDNEICNLIMINNLIEDFCKKKIELKHLGWRTQYTWIFGLNKLDIIPIQNINKYFCKIYGENSLEKINVSDKNSDINLNQNSIDLLKDYYKIDYAIWEKINGRQQKEKNI